MKKISTLIVALLTTLPLLFLQAQSLVVSDTEFLEGDPISFTYDSPDFSTTDWIGIYNAGETPGSVNSIVYQYIPSPSGTAIFEGELAPGDYVAFLLCCDGYDIYAASEQFTVLEGPSITSAKEVYLVGEQLEFSYNSPLFSPTDWIGIYREGEVPGEVNSIDYQYLAAATGTAVFDLDLEPGNYVAFLLCCDGYDVYAQAAFQVEEDGNPVGSIQATEAEFSQGAPITFTYSTPAFSAQDWIGVYRLGDDPNIDLSAAWQYIPAQSGSINFPGTLAAGDYVAFLFCCNSLTVYAQSQPFRITEGLPGAYLAANASVYPQGSAMTFSFVSPQFSPTDWIGIYEKGQTPGDVSSIDFQYIPGAEGYVVFQTDLEPGDYTAYLLCCDSYTVYAVANFSVADENTASLVASKLIYAPGESITFTYNSPDYSATDWIGIYEPGQTPGDVGSIEWNYIPAASGQLVLPGADLFEGHWVAYLFCCDGYDVLASAGFDVMTPTATEERYSTAVRFFPNPTSGWVNFEIEQNDRIERVEVFNAVGRLVQVETMDVDRNAVDLGRLPRGIYAVTLTGREKTYVSRVILQ